MRAGQHDEQRRGVDAPVVAAKGDLVQGGHLAAARFVQDLARLGVALFVHGVGLRRGEVGEDAAEIQGFTQSVSRAVMIPSRPKGVLNHGTPA